MGIQELLRLTARVYSAAQGPAPLPRRTTQWLADLDQVSRRNAMVASTVLAQRRLEQAEVEQFLALHQLRGSHLRRTA